MIGKYFFVVSMYMNYCIYNLLLCGFTSVAAGSTTPFSTLVGSAAGRSASFDHLQIKLNTKNTRNTKYIYIYKKY